MEHGAWGFLNALGAYTHGGGLGGWDRDGERDGLGSRIGWLNRTLVAASSSFAPCSI